MPFRAGGIGGVSPARCCTGPDPGDEYPAKGQAPGKCASAHAHLADKPLVFSIRRGNLSGAMSKANRIAAFSLSCGGLDTRLVAHLCRRHVILACIAQQLDVTTPTGLFWLLTRSFMIKIQEEE